ncbi:hypothetical protein ACQKNX_04815 [Lysinibacillus sp. NPDC093712]|uniref:hypothetical protein n=1 Tax=Lysinibacillus sp. NPDC093712 TaxID=3390579 RepID=UPI003CFD524E
MNQEQMNAIKERVAKATPGPWESEETTEGHIDIFNPNQDYAICQTGNETYDCLNDGDTEFIKHAITDVPSLVAEVERLKIELDAACIANNTLKSEKEALDFQLKVSIRHAEELDEELEAEVAENEQLREVLEFYANENNHFRVDMYADSTVMQDAGKIARQALGGEAN